MKIAVITGASSGMGREFAVQVSKLYRNLDEIWVVARRTERLEELKKNLAVPVRIFDGDLGRDYIYERIEKSLDQKQAKIRLLVNAAGYGKMGLTENLDSLDLCGMIQLNCIALTKMTRLCIPYMERGARVVQVASSAAFAPQPGFAVYAASKSYVYSFSRALRMELKKHGISVTAVCPGPVDTEFFDRAGSLPGKGKEGLLAEGASVVRLALLDAVWRKPVSVYGSTMKLCKIVEKILPDGLLAWTMKKLNHV